MNTKTAKALMMILSLLLCLTFVAGCNKSEPTDTTSDTATDATDATDVTDTTDAPTEPSVNGIEKAEWDSRFTDDIFENYTVIFEGRMSVTEDGEYDSTSDVWQKIKTTADKIEITMRASNVGSSADSEEISLVQEGEAAEVQKVQNSQLFLLILRDYDNFEYDTESHTYIIPEPIVLNEVLKGMNGDGTLFDVPTQIEIREAVATFTADGMLATFTCDYSQTMDIGDQVVNTSGKTTWTFSDFGTTVINK